MARYLLLLTTLVISQAGLSNTHPWPACGTVDSFPVTQWSTADPKGWQSLDKVEALFKELDSKAMMVIHKGQPVLTLGPVEKPYMLASLRKSVLNALYGAYDADRPINMKTNLEALAIDDRPPLSTDEKLATLEDLMGARSGIFHSAHYEQGGWREEKDNARQWALKMFGQANAPHGRVWLYNNWDFNVLGPIYEQISQEKMGDSFLKRLAQPLSMEDFSADDVSYVGNESYAERRQGNYSDHPAYMFHMSTRDLARLGVLFLNCGQWQDKQLIDREWIFRSVQGIPVSQGAPEGKTIHRFYGQYGWLWWVDKPGQRRSFWKLRTSQPVYFGQGARGHYLWIAPYLDLVVVHQVATPGGLSTWDQLRRRFLGSPKITDQQFQEILRLIIKAHPEGATALLTD